jgi:hypothetical protein
MGKELRWNQVSVKDREAFVAELQSEIDRTTDPKRSRMLTAAVGRLQLASKTKAKGARDIETYQTTNLKQRLALEETRAQAISSVVQAVKSTGSIVAAAGVLSVSIRTMFRMMSQFPALGTAVHAAVAEVPPEQRRAKRARAA